MGELLKALVGSRVEGGGLSHPRALFPLQSLPLQVDQPSVSTKETKRQAVAIIFTDDSARTFTCDSGEGMGLQVVCRSRSSW